MNASDHFAQQFRDAMRRCGYWKSMSPDETIEDWQDFVEECEQGYNGGFHEYLEDLSVRWMIEDTVSDPSLVGKPELPTFLNTVHMLDNRFKSILRSDVLPGESGRPWWVAYAPRYAGADLAGDLRLRYGITVQVVD